MPREPKTEQLQLRVSPATKRAIRRQAQRAGLTISEWILRRVVPSGQERFQELVAELAAAEEPGLAFAEILDFLGPLGAPEFRSAVAEPPEVELPPYWANYLAATLEHAAAAKRTESPAWTRDVPPAEEPVFGSELPRLRLYLLASAPAAFRRRNLFVDASVGERV